MGSTAKQKVLFLCTGNSCRSQMAEGWARHLKDGEIEAYSAGMEPKILDPLAVRVMAEAGVDISSQSSKHLQDLADVSFDVVITVCGHADYQCPAFANSTRVVHVGFDDPPKMAESASSAEVVLGHYRRVRDEIHQFVERLPQALDEHDSSLR